MFDKKHKPMAPQNKGAQLLHLEFINEEQPDGDFKTTIMDTTVKLKPHDLSYALASLGRQDKGMKAAILKAAVLLLE